MALSNADRSRRVMKYLAEGKNEKIKTAILALMELSPGEMGELMRLVNG